MKRYSILLLSLLLLVACNGPAKKDKGEKRIITVTIEPQRYFAEALAHGYFRVVSMVPRGSSPETYDPTPKQLIDLGKSDAYLRIGYIGFELTWVSRLTINAPHLEIFETSQGINLILEPSKTKSAYQHMSGIEPHVWCSPTNARIITSNMLKILTALDKDHEKVYTIRYDSLQRQIAHVDSLVRQLLSKPGADHSFAIYHPSLSYFARDYGLKQIAIEENGKEPSPSELKILIDKCKAEKVHIVFVQPEFDRRNAELIAKQIGARVVMINPLNYHWDKEMINVAQVLRKAQK